MNAALEKDLQEALTKHLPQATSDALQERLRQADVDAATVVRQKEQLTTLNTQLNDLQNKLDIAKEELKKHGELSARETAVAEKERNADIAALKVQLEASQSNTKFAQDVAMGLVRNTEYRRNAFDGESRSEPMLSADRSYQTGTANTSSSRTSNTTDTAS